VQVEDGSKPVGKKYLLIETNEESIRKELVSEAKIASQFARGATFERPRALREDRNLRPHQEDGVRWLQTCSQIDERTGVLLADDMGVGKTVQILTFLAWCIESGKFPSLSKSEPPFQPILIVAPLILVDTRTWEKEMEKFFANDGVVFWPFLYMATRSRNSGEMTQLAGKQTSANPSWI
jgi:SNF2 family DNA or RNA helicase